MLHVVQIVMWGVAETPRLFLDEEKARAAYVEYARKQWPQRYAAYCEHNGASGDSFASAEAFVNSIDVSEKSTINYWTLTPEEAGLGGALPESGAGRDEFRRLAAGIDAVKEGLTRLLADVTHLAEQCAGTAGAPAETQADEGPKATVPPAAATVEEPEAAPESYKTAEWQNFVALIKRVCSGSGNQSTLLPRDDWRQDVYSLRTSLEYWDWVADRFRRLKEKARKAGYTVIEEPDVSGCYRFANLQGIASENRYDSEWEAWCAAGLHQERTGAPS